MNTKIPKSMKGGLSGLYCKAFKGPGSNCLVLKIDTVCKNIYFQNMFVDFIDPKPWRVKFVLSKMKSHAYKCPIRSCHVNELNSQILFSSKKGNISLLSFQLNPKTKHNENEHNPLIPFDAPSS